MNKKGWGLKAQALTALVISIAAAILCFLVTWSCSSVILDRVFEKTAYNEVRSEAYLDSFASFVSKNRISAADVSKIRAWRKSNKPAVTLLYITRDGTVLYDSMRSELRTGLSDPEGTRAGEEYAGEDYGNNDWFIKKEIAFTDGNASVSVYGYFDQRIKDAVLIANIVLSALLLCLTFVGFVRRKIIYIIKLEEEIKILETGGLDYPITIRGHDELTSLAEDLNGMRLALLENMQVEAAAVKANYDLVAAVSHDLRTPLTSLSLYLDLILTEKYRDKEKITETLEKARGKVSQIKMMTDQLFERFIFDKDTESPPPPPLPVKALFEDVLSGAVCYLRENGFEVESSLSWPDRETVVDGESVNRIIDNLCSNVLKYADPSQPVLLSVYENKNSFQIRLTNRMRILTEKTESTGIGLRNVRFLMNRLDGDCEIKQSDNVYTICLTFPLTDDPAPEGENDV